MKEYIRNEKDLRIAPTWVLRVNLLSWLLAIILIVVGISFILLKGFEYFITTLSIPFILIIVWGILSDILFVYEENLKIMIDTNKIHIEYSLNQDMLPTSRNKVFIEIRNITKTKVKGKNMIIYGDIVKKAPMKKEVALSNYKVKLNHFKDQQTLMQDIKSKEQKA